MPRGIIVAFDADGRLLACLLLSLAICGSLGSHRAARAADLHLAVPKPCTCSEKARLVEDHTTFEMMLPDPGYPGGGGLCSIAAYLVEEKNCPKEPSCFGGIKILKIKLLSQAPVNQRAECTPFYFPPFSLPFLGQLRVGPFRPGQNVDVHVHWFTSNIHYAVALSGPLEADVSRFGVHLTGRIPESAKSGSILSAVEVSNFQGRQSAAFLVEIGN